jgi:hypothetical protein
VHGTDARRVDDDPVEVDHVGPAEPVEQQAVQRVPHAGPPPVVQPVPQGHPATPEFVREVLPRQAGLQDEQDAGQADAVVDRRVRVKLRRCQSIMSNVRWNYGPPFDVTVVPADGGADQPS